jgi:NitT/TauT family transport system substrate-binding protein
MIARLLGAIAVAAVVAVPAWGQDKVKVGVFPVSSSLPVFVAQDRGFFKG